MQQVELHEGTNPIHLGTDDLCHSFSQFCTWMYRGLNSNVSTWNLYTVAVPFKHPQTMLHAKSQ